jgi:hypothetical protein
VDADALRPVLDNELEQFDERHIAELRPRDALGRLFGRWQARSGEVRRRR